MNGPAVLAAGAAGWLMTAIATRGLGLLALRLDLVDRPTGYKSHARPTPYLGGVAIALGTLLPAVALSGALSGEPPFPGDRRIAAIVVAAMAVGLLGLVDDIRSLSPLSRLAVETPAATAVVLCGVCVPLTGGWLDGPLTVAWIVVITNSFNLLDNMDGALASVAVVTAGLLSVTAFLSGHPAAGLLLTTLACACLGFLPHNWAPAKIFMGDAGSLFVGFTLACCAVLLIPGDGPALTAAGLLLPAFVATVDTGVVVVARRRAGRPVLSGGRDHLSHRLRRLGLSTRATALTLAACAALTGVIGLLVTLRVISPIAAAIIVAITASAVAGLIQKMHVHPQGRPAGPARIHERRP
ncbi:MraY family glycosyltransferase [Sphaerisporangium aureirubrum]|uniref:MraY family glycosyltransferase n=1 Tax=Sphaerisporangium aureirubrum TaxID=1544736 RepID=A0ABW1NV44_9ACTN